MSHGTETQITQLVGKHPGRLGALAALASLPAHLYIPLSASYQLAAVILGLVGGIYVGFALNDGSSKMVAVEAVVALCFVGAALAGVWLTVWAIPAAYALHGLWDMAHHHYIATAMPRWYIPLCAVYDWIFAGGLVAIWLVR